MDKPEVPAIGIDLGTTNSAIALWRDGKVRTFNDSSTQYCRHIQTFFGQ
ncbi:MAG: hypothetical protein SAqTSA_38820 [Shewanella algae]